MSNDSNPIEICGVKLPEKVLEDAYQDLGHPVASEAGKLIASPIKLVNWIIECGKNYFAGGKENTQKLQEEVQEKIDQLPPGQVCEPPKNIAIPAIIANSYTDEDSLRSLYASLIANSMNKQLAGMAHPSFVEIIKQLTPDEALLLKTTNMLKEAMPICQIRYQKVKTSPFMSSKDINKDMNLHKDNIVRYFNEGRTLCNYYMPYIQSIPANELQIMIDNFLRLNLIDSPNEMVIADKNAYLNFYKDDFNISLEKKYANPDDKTYELAHILGLIEPTNYGERFYEICVK